jgi:hypothetical protein
MADMGVIEFGEKIKGATFPRVGLVRPYKQGRK